MATFIIADDSKIARTFLKTVLSENGHEVIAEATNGEEGYELYAKLMPDIIVLDITMPVLNGLECLKRLKSEYPRAKVIIVSSIGKESKKTEALMAGAIDYIVKPYDPELAMEVFDKCIRA